MNQKSGIKFKEEHVFWFVMGLIYLALFFVNNALQGPLWDDENGFWETTLQFSGQLLPSLEQLRDYNQFSTPLPFILYGMLEYLFKAGPFAARMVSFLLSIAIAFLIGWPGKQRSSGPIFALLGLFLFPWFLWLSARLYTDIIASFFVLVGVTFYLRQRHLFSSLMFVFAIACRQFMVAFPVAIAAHELLVAIRHRRRPSISFFSVVLAALSILAWVLLFDGLTPSIARQARDIPEVQQVLWSFSIGNGLFFLSTLGWAYVIPELLLFRRQVLPANPKWIKLAAIAIALIVLYSLFTPEIIFLSVFTNLTDRLPYGLYFCLMFGLGLATCWRFSKVDLMFWMIAFNFIIMMKAVTWDKYALPLVIVLWYLKARDLRGEAFDPIAAFSPENLRPLQPSSIHSK